MISSRTEVLAHNYIYIYMGEICVLQGHYAA